MVPIFISLVHIESEAGQMLAARRFDGFDQEWLKQKNICAPNNFANIFQNSKEKDNEIYEEFVWEDNFTKKQKTEVGSRFREFVRDSKLVGHMAGGMLEERVRELDGRYVTILDTAVLARVFFPCIKHYSLAALRKSFGLDAGIADTPVEPAGTADLAGSAGSVDPADMTRAIGQIYALCWEKALSYDVDYFLRTDQVVKPTIYRDLFEALKKAVAGYSGKPVMTGLFACREGDGVDSCSEPLAKKRLQGGNYGVPKDFRWASSCFGRDGLLASVMPGFEGRKAQVEMSQHIVDAFDTERHMVIEAETGTGKSMAYLLPAIWWAKLMDKKVVIATHTIPLQEQLFSKDLPFLADVLPFSFQAALLKGRNNYICPWLFEQIFPQGGGHEGLGGYEGREDDNAMIWPMLLSWLRETETGDLNELPQLSQLSALWPRINADTALCIPQRCRYARQCFMLKARKRAQESDVVVVNHSLFFLDMKAEILPEYDYLVVDEAHNLYGGALKHLGFELSRDSLSYLCERWRKTGRGSTFAVWRDVLRKMRELCSELDYQNFDDLLNQCPALAMSIDEQAGQTFDLLAQILGDRLSTRLTQKNLHTSVQELFAVEIENLSGRLEAFDKVLHGMMFCLDASRQLSEFKFYITRDRALLSEWISGLRRAADLGDELCITYLEKSSLEKTSRVWLKNAPLDIASLLKEKLFDQKKVVILCSATLSVAGDFSYFMGEVGLEGDCAGTLALQSNFDYQSQMLSCIVSGFSSSGASGSAEYRSAEYRSAEYRSAELRSADSFSAISPMDTENVLAREVASFVAEAARLVGGRTLVLFTSHRLLRLVNRALLDIVGENAPEILAQGIHGSRDARLENFRTNPYRILLGSSSFWEGIDLPGEELSCLIMVRLPFWPPSMPVIEARSELMQKMGQSPFYELLLPEAVIRFKQGFGRLLRTREDRGVFILLDDRVVTKRYGPNFLKSLPKRAHVRGNRVQVLGKIEEFLSL
jgi:ATP-dependent DNA helicase DinG